MTILGRRIQQIPWLLSIIERVLFGVHAVMFRRLMKLAPVLFTIQIDTVASICYEAQLLQYTSLYFCDQEKISKHPETCHFQMYLYFEIICDAHITGNCHSQHYIRGSFASLQLHVNWKRKDITFIQLGKKLFYSKRLFTEPEVHQNSLFCQRHSGAWMALSHTICQRMTPSLFSA